MKRSSVCCAAALALSVAACAADRVTAAAPPPVSPRSQVSPADARDAVAEALAGRVPPLTAEAARSTGAVIHLRPTSSILPEHPPLFVVDGRPMSQAELQAMGINPASIADIRVIQGPAAVARYGSAAEYGAVLITLRGR